MAEDLSKVTKQYSNSDITVVWKPGLCIHSMNCFTGLPEVFDPKKRPWVDITGAPTQKITAQVDKCPSGALSYLNNSEIKNPPATSESVAEVIAEPKPNGPLFVYGNITVKMQDGSSQKKTKITAFCRCGNSKNKPFCDGSHLAAGFKG